MLFYLIGLPGYDIVFINIPTPVFNRKFTTLIVFL